MPLRLRTLAAGALSACAVLAAAAPAVAVAAEPSFRPGSPPEACDGDLFSDQIGTNRGDELTAPLRPQRLWGLAGPDRLTGSATRATCLFGGRDGDVLDLRGGGGIAYGEGGDDWVVGGPLADSLDGGDGLDGFEGGDGGDKLETQDGRAEIVSCGAGNDLVDADRADLLLDCEVALRSGGSTPSLVPVPRAARNDGIVRIRYRVPVAAGAGAYRVLLTSGPREPGCAGGPRELTRFPVPGRRVRAGQRVRVGLRPPEGGWCPGIERAVVVLHRACPITRFCTAPVPGEPVARVRFSAAR